MITYQPGDFIQDIDGHVGIVDSVTDTHVSYTVGRAKFRFTREHVFPWNGGRFYFDADPAPQDTPPPNFTNKERP